MTKVKLMDQPVYNRFTGEVQFTAKIEADPSAFLGFRLGLAVKWGLENKAYLAEANLGGAYLAEANLAGANLAGANLAEANLAGANLAGAYLAEANLAGANLAGANLAGAYLAGAYLGGANLAGANLAEAYLAEAYLAGANLAEAYLAEANLAEANLAGANLAGAYLGGAVVRGEKITRLLTSADRMDGHTFFAFALEAGGVKIMAGCRWFTVAEFRAHVAAEYPDTDKAAETLDLLAFIEARAKSLGVALESEAA